jgi:hypothetical protein
MSYIARSPIDRTSGNRGKMPGAAADQAGRIFALT